MIDLKKPDENDLGIASQFIHTVYNSSDHDPITQSCTYFFNPNKYIHLEGGDKIIQQPITGVKRQPWFIEVTKCVVLYNRYLMRQLEYEEFVRKDKLSTYAQWLNRAEKKKPTNDSRNIYVKVPIDYIGREVFLIRIKYWCGEERFIVFMVGDRHNAFILPTSFGAIFCDNADPDAPEAIRLLISSKRETMYADQI